MDILLMGLAIVLVAAGILRLTHARHPVPARPGRRPAAGPSSTPRPGGIDKLKASGLFWGIELAQPGCEVARHLQGKQYPFEEAPELPLAGCGSAACTCQFRGLRKQRTGSTRRRQSDRREEVRFDLERPDRRGRVSRRRADKWGGHTH